METTGIRAVDRALLIVHYLAEERRPAGIADIAHATGLAPATVHRVLAALMERDWVEQNPRTSKYRLGFGLLGVAAAVTNYSPLVDRARPVLRRVSEVSGLDAFLGVLVGTQIAYLAMAEGDDRPSRFNAGLLQPAHATSAGKVLLAALSEEELSRLYPKDRKLVTYTPFTVRDVDELRAELARIQEDGLGWDRGEMKESWHAVAVPIRGPDGRVIAAMKTGGRAEQATQEHLRRVAEEMHVLAVELSLQLELGD